MKETWMDRARKRMSELGITQEDLKEALGVKTRGAIGHYLSGRRDLSADQFGALAKKLQCSVDELMFGFFHDNEVVEPKNLTVHEKSQQKRLLLEWENFQQSRIDEGLDRMSISEASEKTGLSVKTINRCLGGQSAITPSVIAAFSTLFGVPRDVLDIMFEDHFAQQSDLARHVNEEPIYYDQEFTKYAQGYSKILKTVEEVMLLAKSMISESGKTLSPEKEVAFTMHLIRSHLEGRTLSKEEVTSLLTLAA